MSSHSESDEQQMGGAKPEENPEEEQSQISQSNGLFGPAASDENDIQLEKQE